MGRRPNGLILQYFERGPKLADNSNRYPHTCKACGENFPKGRIDSLTAHLTKKCPAISEADRINACLTLHGIHHASRGQKSRQVQPNGPPVDLPMMQRDWTALETLAEVSRQIEANEKPGEDRSPAQAVSGSAQPGEADAIENPPINTKSQPLKDAKDENAPSETGNKDLLPVENLTALIQSATESESANLSMAAAATARLNPSLLDADADFLPDDDLPPTDAALAQSLQQTLNGEAGPVPGSNAAQPWGEITYMSDPFPASNVGDVAVPSPADLAKGSFRMDAGNGLNGSKSRHSRARFDANRRKEVQEVRKIGACIRCRILRKTCSKGHPCDTCRKVLSPRVWRSGCVRTKFSEQLDLYSAGVQIVLAQNRVNLLKAKWPLAGHGTKVIASHFPEKGILLTLDVLERELLQDGTAAVGLNPQTGLIGGRYVVMIDNDSQDVPGHLEAYMREVLPEFCRLEPSHFMRVTLEKALGLAQETNDDLLKKALELWGLVELLDRERQWSIRLTSAGELEWIKDDADHEKQEMFTTMCLQLAAAAERKAGTISKSLLTGMQRVLQDSKSKIGFSMYFATLILLNSVEKSTWAFKAWEQDNLRQLWPLPKDPSAFSQQGYVIADLLRMLLAIRKALPRTACRQEDGILITEDEDPLIREYFETVNLSYAEVQAKQENPAFSPTDPRSFELLFCSTLLLPGRD